MFKPRSLRPARTFLAGGPLILVILAGIKAMPTGEENRPVRVVEPSDSSGIASNAGLEQATFGAGCFWCVEAVFQGLKGVHKVVSGYSGGHVKNPSYRQVCSGSTGHAEAVQVWYDPTRITYAELLEVFWGTHDPTTRDRQGFDVGTQYRSVIFYHGDEQRRLAEDYKRQLDASGSFGTPIVTEIAAFREFFPAEDYHQNYYELNAHQPYCLSVIRPKVEKLKKAFRDKLADQAPEPAPGANR
jgi:peptide-methionine (S)-S-oxide reductase